MESIGNIIISGGTGLIGKRLSKILAEEGYSVYLLTRNRTLADKPEYIYWNLNDNEINSDAIKNADAIIHLAGENIGAGRWTKKRKRDIIDSRVKSAEMIFKNIDENRLKCFISASAIGYYGAITTDHTFSESDNNGNDFSGQVCKLWESSADTFARKGIRTVKLRTGIVLSMQGGALPKIIRPIKYGIGAAIGSGKQFMPWIHIDDLCKIYLKALKDHSITGVYNAVAPEHVTNKDFTLKSALFSRKKVILPNIPSFIFRLIFGEMSSLLLNGSKVSCNKIESTGFTFTYPDIDNALKNLLQK